MKGKFLAFPEFFWWLEEGSIPSKHLQEKDGTDMTDVLNIKLILHSMYGISNLKNDTF